MRRKKINEWLTDEKSLAKIVVEYLESSGFDVFQEVETVNGYCDIVATKNEELFTIETKMQFSFDVLEQAKHNKKIANYTYIAVPFPKKGSLKFKCEIATLLGIGVIVVYPDKSCELITESQRINKIKRKPKLKDWQKDNEAGGKERMTSFKRLIIDINDYLILNESASFKELYENIDVHYSNYNSFRGSITKYIKEGFLKEFEIKDGKLYIKS